MTRQKGPMPDAVRLSNGLYVPRAVHDELFEKVVAGIRQLSYDRPYKAREMLEPLYYAHRDPWQVGGCVADWERAGLLRVRFLGCRYCSVRYYGRT